VLRDEIGHAPAERAHRGFVEIEIRELGRFGHDRIDERWH
jgi:hypothetical protein